MKNLDRTIKYRVLFLAIASLAAASLAACSKDEQPAPDYDEKNLAELSVEFDNIAGSRTLQLNTGEYTNAAGEKFSVSRLQYYVSNIELTTVSGETYTVPQDSSYFLVMAGDRGTRFAKVKVPEGDYKTLRFTLGVDSLRCTMPVDKRTGVLDPAGDHDGAGMYWGWNSGYIFLKLEGNSPAVTLDGDPTGKQQFKYHIGGFGGYSAPTINNIKQISIDLEAAGIAQVRKGFRSNIHLFADVMKVFNGETDISLAAHPNVMFSEYSVHIADNYVRMFSHDHTENFVKSEDEL